MDIQCILVVYAGWHVIIMTDGMNLIFLLLPRVHKSC